jgi:hypothetical protein
MGRGGTAVTVFFGGRRRLVLLVAGTFGALGSFLHVAKSFATFAGIRKLLASWIWWYCLQHWRGWGWRWCFTWWCEAGSGRRARMRRGSARTEWRGLGAGREFSNQATEKLNEVFSTLSSTGNDGGLAGEPRW